jgi:hypothetical protein
MERETAVLRSIAYLHPAALIILQQNPKSQSRVRDSGILGFVVVGVQDVGVKT